MTCCSTNRRQSSAGMDVNRHPSPNNRVQRSLILLAVACVLLPRIGATQGLTGALIGTVKDNQGGALVGAQVRLSSLALIGGPATLTTNEKGQLRFPSLPPGSYVLDIEMQGFASLHEEDISIGAGATIERTAILKLGDLAESVVVEGAGSRIDARNAGFATRFGPEDTKVIPTRRQSLFDLDQNCSWNLADLAGKHELARIRVRLRRQREHVSRRRHELHGHEQRRRAHRAGHRLHSGNTDPVGGRLRRAR